MFKGSYVALITPMRTDGSIDEKKLEALVDWQIREGTNGLVPTGTTGESPTLTHAEHKRVVEVALSVAKGRVPVIAGTGSNSTAEAIDLTKHAKAAGADAAMLVTPYYNKPTQEGLYLHFKAVAEAVDIPIIVYNIPGRSVVNITVETMARIAKIPNIVGVKDATNDLARPYHTRATCGEGFAQMSGEDATILAFLSGGGHGCISVTGNIAPRLCSSMHVAWSEGRIKDATAIQDRLMPLHDALFSETSPGPIKYAASLLGLTAETVRLPLAPPGEGTRARVREAMTNAGLLN